jgi:hypothetical protein
LRTDEPSPLVYRRDFADFVRKDCRTATTCRHSHPLTKIGLSWLRPVSRQKGCRRPASLRVKRAKWPQGLRPPPRPGSRARCPGKAPLWCAHQSTWFEGVLPDSRRAEEIIAMTMKYRPVPISKLVVETPEPLHGDTTANPIPAPKESRRSVSAKEATAPAATAAQDTPGTAGSTTSVSVPCRIDCSMEGSLGSSCLANAQRTARFQTPKQRPELPAAIRFSLFKRLRRTG